METKVGKFTFKVPEGFPDAGKKIEKAFDYQETTDEAEATQVLTDKKWNLKDMVDEALKANARSNAYQTALMPYKPTEKTVDEMLETAIRNLIRAGIPEATAREMVSKTHAAVAQ